MSQLTYFQYFKEHNYPLALCIDIETFGSECFNGLKLLGFSEITEEEWKGLKKSFIKVEVVLPAPSVSHYIKSSTLSGFKGKESLALKAKYKVYKLQGRGLLEFSDKQPRWIISLLAAETSSLDQFQSEFIHLMNRTISWALIKLSCVGFWGIPVTDGLIGMKPSESNSEAFFVDLKNQRILSVDGVIPLADKLQILRLDSTLRDRSRGMKPEEVYSFLLHRAALFHPIGTHRQVKLAVTYLASYAKGIVWPKDSFNPRVNTDATLMK